MINLLPAEHKQAIRFGRYNISLIKYMGVAALIAIVCLGLLFVGSQVQSNEGNDLQQRINLLRDEAMALEPSHKDALSLNNEIQTIATILNREISFSEFLPEIAAVLPEGSALTGLTLDDSQLESLQMTALVRDQSSAAVLQENLIASDLFSGADIEFVSVLTGENQVAQYGAEVSITAFFAPTVAPSTRPAPASSAAPSTTPSTGTETGSGTETAPQSETGGAL